MNLSKHWYAVYTKPRWEKKVNQLFRQKGFETYCPLARQRRQWSDRVKIVEEPLFRSYVFVRLDESELTRARMIDGVVNFVYWCGKPAVVRDEEIVIIRKFLNEHQHVEMMQTTLKEGGKALVQQGIFMNEEGLVVKVRSKTVELRLERLGLALVATLDRSNVLPMAK